MDHDDAFIPSQAAISYTMNVLIWGAMTSVSFERQLAG
jgi:hypothetical protein